MSKNLKKGITNKDDKIKTSQLFEKTWYFKTTMNLMKYLLNI